MANKETWNFALVGCDSQGNPKYLGFTETYDEAIKLEKNMAILGWRQVAVFDAALQEAKENSQKAGK
jgi:hypothetical protein